MPAADVRVLDRVQIDRERRRRAFDQCRPGAVAVARRRHRLPALERAGDVAVLRPAAPAARTCSAKPHVPDREAQFVELPERPSRAARLRRLLTTSWPWCGAAVEAPVVDGQQAQVGDRRRAALVPVARLHLGEDLGRQGLRRRVERRRDERDREGKNAHGRTVPVKRYLRPTLRWTCGLSWPLCHSAYSWSQPAVAAKDRLVGPVRQGSSRHSRALTGSNVPPTTPEGIPASFSCFRRPERRAGPAPVGRSSTSSSGIRKPTSVCSWAGCPSSLATRIPRRRTSSSPTVRRISGTASASSGTQSDEAGRIPLGPDAKWGDKPASVGSPVISESGELERALHPYLVAS